MRELVGGADGLAIDVERVALRRVVGAIVVPHHGHVLAVVAQVVHHEVVPTGHGDRVELDLVVLTRNDAGHVLDHRPVGGTQLGVVDPGTIGDLAAVLRGVGVLLRKVAARGVVVHVPELVLVGIAIVAALIVRERHPVEQLLVHLVGDVAVLRGVVVADAGGVDLQQRRRVDDREVVGTRVVQRLLVGLVGGEEREDRELVGVREQTQGVIVLSVGRHQAFRIRIVVVQFLVLRERVVFQPLVEHQLLVGVPQVVEHVLLDVVGDLLHLLGVLGVARGLVRLRRGVGVRPQVRGTVGAVHALSGTSRLGEGDGVRVVAGHGPPGPVDQVVAVVVLVVVVVGLVLGVQQALDVFGTVIAKRLGQRRWTAVHHVGIPAGLGDVLRVAVVPVGRIARIVVVVVVSGLALLGGLASGDPGAIRVFGVAEPLGVVDEHAGGQHDLVVVSEHAFDGGRVLEGVARHVGVQHVEAAQPPAVEHRLVDVVLRGLHVRDVLVPPLVVGGDGILVGGGGIDQVAGVACLVFLGGVRKLVGDEAQLHLGGLRLVRAEMQGAHQFAALGGESVAGETRIDGGQIVLHVHAAGQLRRAVGTGRCERGRGGERDVARGRGGDLEVRHHHVVVGDVLRFLDADGFAASGEFGGEVARGLLALRGVLGQCLVLAVGVHGQGEAVLARLVPVGGVAHEAQLARGVGVHVRRAAAGEQVVVAVGAGILVFAGVVLAGTGRRGALAHQHLVDPEIMVGVGAGAVGHVLVEHLLEVTGGWVEGHSGRRNGILVAFEGRVSHGRIRIGDRIGGVRRHGTARQQRRRCREHTYRCDQPFLLPL